MSTSTVTVLGRTIAFLTTVYRFVLSQWFLLTLGLFIALAYFFPTVGTTGGPIRAEYTIAWGAVALIFLIAGLSLSLTALLHGLGNVKAHLVSNCFSFLLVPAVTFGFATAGRTGGLDYYVLVGMIVAGCVPTTVASNVTCTRLAGGNTELASVEVVLGNVVGVFVTPLLLEMFLTSRSGWGQASPQAGGVSSIYIQMAKQLSATLLAPLIVGLSLQMLFPKAVARTRQILRLDKVASFMLILCVWENFCKAFHSGAFDTTSAATIIYVCFINLTVYLLLTVVMIVIVRLPWISARWAHWWRLSKRDTIALAFCGPAKGVALGGPLIAIFYASASDEIQAKLALSLVIYQGEQVACAQIVVPILRRWAREEIEALESGQDASAAVSLSKDSETCFAFQTKESYLTVYFVRHGQTNDNANHIIQGWVDTPLNEIGRRQACAAQTGFAQLCPLDEIFSSDLCRAHETGQLVTLTDAPKIVTDDRLRERFLGSLQVDWLFSEPVFMNQGTLHEGGCAAFDMKDLDDAESWTAFSDRLMAFWSDAVSRGREHTGCNEHRIAVFTHGGSIIALLEALGIRPPTRSVANCSLTELTLNLTSMCRVMRQNYD